MKKIITLSVLIAALTACNNNATNSSTTATATTQSSEANNEYFSDITSKNLGQLPPYTWYDKHLQGSVKQLTEYVCGVIVDENGNPKPSNMVSDTGGVNVTEFNEEGFITRVRNYDDEGGSLLYESQYVYDDLKRLIAINGQDSEGNTLTEKFTYDDNGYLQSYTSQYNNNPESKRLFTNEITNVGLRSTERSGDPSIGSETVRTYNKQNLLLTEENYYDNANAPSSQTRYTYNAQNRKSKTEYQGFGENKFLVITYFSYDKNGNITEIAIDETSYENGDDELGERKTITRYTYDSKGNVTQAFSPEAEMPTTCNYKLEYY